MHVYIPIFPHEFRDSSEFNLLIHHICVYIYPDIIYMCIYQHFHVYSRDSRGTVRADTPPSRRRCQDNPKCNMLKYCIHVYISPHIIYMCTHVYFHVYSRNSHGTVSAKTPSSRK